MQSGGVALITAAALLMGVLLWVGLRYWQRQRSLSARSLLRVLLVVGGLCRIGDIWFTPIFYASDEQSHFNYVKYVSENYALPIQAGKMGESDNEWEYFQPPLYYLTLLPIYKLADAMFHSQAATVFALRVGSLLLWLVNLRLGWVLLKRLEVKDEFLQVSTLAVTCLLPTYVVVSSAINNDNLMITFATGLLCLIAQPQRSIMNSLAMGAVLGLALWVKQSALIFFPAIGLLFLFEGVRRNISWPGVLSRAASTFGVAALIYSPWSFRNWYVYETFTPEDLSVVAKTWPSMMEGLLAAGHNLAKTFWSVSGISNNIGYPFPLLGLSYGFIAICGLVIGLKQNPEPLARFPALPMSSVYAAIGVAILVNVILVLRFGYLYGMGHGRELFPLLYPIAILLAWGVKFIPARNPSLHVVGFWITYTLGFEAFSLARFATV
ncbi:MAG TPA: hypothetical protein VFZ59_05240 [Verrucomicrobiae bacterium]|nr:hypothetical protein [Verrucomicrobiae bacterium]